MPSMPPFARRERIEDYRAECEPVGWREERVMSADGVELALAVGGIEGWDRSAGKGQQKQRRHVVVVYFQGYIRGLRLAMYKIDSANVMYSNGSSIPPRLPGLSLVLKNLQASNSSNDTPMYTVVAPSYRGFWTSRGRPSERGIMLDAAAALDWVSQTFPSDSAVVLWGQSLGAAVAATAVAARLQNKIQHEAVIETRYAKKLLEDGVRSVEIKGLLLETPFTSIRAMIVAIYPQKWLPYRYLHPFLWNHWDSKKAIAQIAQSGFKPMTLILQAGGDELVPESHGYALERECEAGDINVERVVVKGALHHEVLAKPKGRQAVVSFLITLGETA